MRIDAELMRLAFAAQDNGMLDGGVLHYLRAVFVGDLAVEDAKVILREVIAEKQRQD